MRVRGSTLSFDTSVAISHIGQSPICLVEKGFSVSSRFLCAIPDTIGRMGFAFALRAIAAGIFVCFFVFFGGNDDSAATAVFSNASRHTSNKIFS